MLKALIRHKMCFQMKEFIVVLLCFSVFNKVCPDWKRLSHKSLTSQENSSCWDNKRCMILIGPISEIRYQVIMKLKSINNTKPNCFH